MKVTKSAFNACERSFLGLSWVRSQMMHISETKHTLRLTGLVLHLEFNGSRCSQWNDELKTKYEKEIASDFFADMRSDISKSPSHCYGGSVR